MVFMAETDKCTSEISINILQVILECFDVQKVQNA